MARHPEERKHEDRKMDEAVEDTFPASDPPSHSSTPKSEKIIKKPRGDDEADADHKKKDESKN